MLRHLKLHKRSYSVVTLGATITSSTLLWQQFKENGGEIPTTLNLSLI